MRSITFITGNPKKAEYLMKYLGLPIEHQKIELEEIQSLDLREIAQYKVRQAYKIVQKPVLIEDVSLEFESLGRLPGPFIKFFMQELGVERLCNFIPSENRKATARCIFGFYDGERMEFFDGSIAGTISEDPRGDNGFDWDKIFIPYFSDKTAAELGSLDYERFQREQKPFEEIRKFLLTM